MKSFLKFAFWLAVAIKLTLVLAPMIDKYLGCVVCL